jgi:magnesium transporter
LFVFQMATIYVMAHYEGQLRQVVFLIAYIPLCISVGGNAGSQAATLVTRALALQQITVRDWLRIFRRELLMGLTLALALGILSVIRSYFLTPGHMLAEVPGGKYWDLVWVITYAVMGICLCGTLIGAMLPLLIKWIGGDPALMSSPFIATLSDVLGIVIFFNIAYVFFF